MQRHLTNHGDQGVVTHQIGMEFSSAKFGF